MERTERKHSVLLWSDGSEPKEIRARIREEAERGGLEIAGVCSAAASADLDALGPPYVPGMTEYDEVMVLCSGGKETEKTSIAQCMEATGAAREKIVPARVLFLPGMTFERYLRIRDARITIFSSLCWGGVAYYTLGLPCLSPFKNLWMLEEDYLAFLKSPEEYIKEKPVLHRMQKATTAYDRTVYPVLSLGGLMLHYNHARTPEEAIDDWETGAARINWDFILAMMHTEQPETERRFLNLDTDMRRLCIVPYKSESPYAVCCPRSKNLWAFDVAETARANRMFDFYELFFGGPERWVARQ